MKCFIVCALTVLCATARAQVGRVDTIGGTTYDSQFGGPAYRWIVNAPGHGIPVMWMRSQSEHTLNPSEFAVRVAPVAKGSPTIQVDVPGPARMRLTFHDVTGRMMIEMADVNPAPGRHWLDPMSAASGTGRLAPGAYFVRYQSEYGQGLLRFTLVR